MQLDSGCENGKVISGTYQVYYSHSLALNISLERQTWDTIDGDRQTNIPKDARCGAAVGNS